MTFEQRNKIELECLLSIALEGELTEEQSRRINELLEDPRMRRCYFRFLGITTALRRLEWQQVVYLPDREEAEVLDNDLWQALAEDEQTAPAVYIEKKVETPAALEPIETVKIERRIPKSSIYSLILSAAAILLIVIMVVRNPQKPVSVSVAATVTEQLDAQWQWQTVPMNIGSELTTEKYHYLSRGLVKLELLQGTEVVIESPAEFKLESDNQVLLLAGKLSAVVPKHATGFTVRTPEATVVDHGTEFGVSVDEKGRTEAHVFAGCVDLRVGVNIDEQISPENILRLNAGQSGAVADNSVKRISLKTDKFIRAIPTSLYEIAVKRSKPLAYWQFNDIAKGAVNTIQPTEFLGEPQGVLQFAEVSVHSQNKSSALHLNSDSFIKVALGNIPASGYSWVCWLNVQQEGPQTILATRIGGSERRLMLTADLKLQQSLYNAYSSKHDVVAVSDSTIEKGRWYHIAFTATSNEDKLIYINGVLQGENDQMGEVVSLYPEFYIGADCPDLPNQNPRFNGFIDELSIYNRVLEPAEISNLYQAMNQ